MRAHGGLDQLAVIHDAPTPQVTRHRDVRVRLRAAALNHLDLWTLHGLPGLSVELPHILGGDGAGVVDDVGDDVTRVQPGERVLLNPGIACYRCQDCERGDHPLCPEYRLLGEHRSGTLAQYIVVPEQNVVPIPEMPEGAEPLSWGEAAAFGLVTLTAWRMLTTRARVRAGEAVLIHGVGGGVSSTALRVAKLVGALVVATSSSDAKLAKARELGADVTINYENEDVVQATRAALGRKGVDVVIENVGEATWDTSLRLLDRGGRLVSCGATTGPRAQIDIRRLFWYQWSILGSTMGSLAEFDEIVRLLGQGKLRPLVDATVLLDRASEAFGKLESGAHMGKLVVAIE